MADHSLLVVEPGLLTTVQDLGRPGAMRFGVAPGGALDRAALILGNRLVGNPAGAAGLEITFLGPRLRFGAATVVALTGADLGATLNGAAAPCWVPVSVAAGDEIGFAPPVNATGARAYLCVAGGIAVAPVMGSRSTDLFGGFGGWRGRGLRAGDHLPLGEAGAPLADLPRLRLVAPPPRHDPTDPVRIVLGPQQERFTDEGLATFLGAAFAVSAKADRMGVRLTGPAIAHHHGADLISEGIAHGAVQIPGDGAPIVLLAARQTVGGYPKIATVIGADLDGLGQRRPGDPVRFIAVDVPAARALTRDYLDRLDAGAVITALPPATGWSPTEGTDAPSDDEGGGDAAGGWDAAAVAHLIGALREAGVSYLRLEVATAGINLELRRGPDGELGPAATEGAVAASKPDRDKDLVTAPVLGIFYRRTGPDQPPLAEEGHRVEAGQPLGLLEVMKTYHEVTSPHAGVLIAFLVEDGQFVEYGEPIARVNARG